MITTGAPFNIVLPITVTNGSISGGTISVMIPQGSAASASFTVIGTSAKVSFGYLPGLPNNHYGYTLAQSTVCNRTEAVADAIAKAVGVTDCSALTEVDLATITSLDISGVSLASLAAGDFDGMLSLRSLYLGNNELTGLPSGIFDDLVSLRELFLSSNKLTTLPGGIFSNLTSLTNLYLQGNDLSSLSSDAFDGLSSLTSLTLTDNELTSLSGSIFDGIPNVRSILLSQNKLTSIPNGIFDGLTSLSQLHLSWNPIPTSLLSLTVSLQKVGTNQFKAVVPIGAPFVMTLPVTIQNGTIAGGTTTIMIPTGKVESQPLTVTRTPGTVNAVIANIGTPLPTRPATHNGYALVKSTTLPIEVLAPLNSAPIFTEGVNTIRTVAENTAAGVNIGDAVTATDQDANTTLTYTLGGTDAGSFSIDSATGQLKTKAALDYETQNAYSIVLTVSDGQVTDTITVTINISNVNEAPVFAVGSSTTHTVAENTAAGENIGSPVSATDDDGDTLSCSLSGTDAGKFSIDSTNGQLQTSAALDYETKSSYTVTVSVSDGKGGTDSITVTINVTDVSEVTNNAPVFTDGTSTTRSVAENTAANTNIGSAVSATDADNDTLTYTLGGTDAASFSIVSTSGQLQTSAALDYETKSSYTVTVSVSDGKGGTDSITVTINVTDVSEVTNNAPVFADGTTTTRSVAENTAANTNIGSAVSATDADNDTLTYTLGGTDAASFSIVSTSGQLQTSAALDYETKSSYSVTVSVSDVRGGTDSITVTINVTDVSEATITLISDRAQQVQDAIVVAINGVESASDVTAEHLAAITSLNLNDKGITSLQTGDFDGLTALTTLWLSYNSISDISPLDGLTALTTLDLDNNSISDISPLDGLTALTTLDLDNNSISDISPLDGLTALTTLDLDDNSISNISPLDGLTALTTLDLDNNSISDISPLDGLTALTTLDLGSNSISDISPLDGLTALTWLDLGSNSISDISPLDGLTALTWLDLGYNRISNISPLDGLTALTTLWLSNNRISDISPLDGLTALTTLYLDNNRISDYGPLRRLKAAIEAIGDHPGLTIDITIPEEGNGAPTLSAVPTTTALLANFPNPFNPETWIPYQLSKSAKVTLTIYNMRGVVVRQLELGHQSAGVYRSRSRAVHWDGRNMFGEKVAAGVYFYTLEAGDFTATRKMLIRK